MSKTPESELSTLGRFLDASRGACLFKLDGLSEGDARRPMVPSGNSLLSIVKHLGYVERWWYRAVLAGEDPEFPWSDEDPDADWRLEESDTVASVAAFYAAECDVSRRIHEALDDPEVKVTFGPNESPVRDIVVHMIEETARHAGHMDIMRELIDGATGGFAPGGAPWA